MDDYTTQDFLNGMEVKPASIADWLTAVNGFVKLTVPRVRTDKVVPQSGFVPMEWAVVA